MPLMSEMVRSYVAQRFGLLKIILILVYTAPHKIPQSRKRLTFGSIRLLKVSEIDFSILLKMGIIRKEFTP